MSRRVGKLGLVETRVGHVGVLTDASGALARVLFGRNRDSSALARELEAEGWQVASPDEGTERALTQIAEYFDSSRRAFELPLALNGTPFQIRVWEALLEIPYGRTATYGQIAEAVSARGGGRAVGRASHVNPLPIVVPCHRVVGADGDLVGFGGGLEIKQRLLEHERGELGCRQELLFGSLED